MCFILILFSVAKETAGSINFPKAEKINFKELSQPSNPPPIDTIQPTFAKWWDDSNTKDDYKKDLSKISDENTQRINQMSQEEIKNSIDEIYKNFSPAVIEKLKAMAQRQAQTQQATKVEEQKLPTPTPNEGNQKPTAPVLNEPPSNATTNAYHSLVKPKEDETEEPITDISKVSLYEKEIFVKRNGEFKVGNKENLENQSLLISDVLKITEDTKLDEKYFSSNDLVFLLHSSYVPHRLLALSIVEKFVSVNQSEVELLKDLLIDKDILDAGFTVLYNSPGITTVYQLKLFGLLNSLLTLILPSVEDELSVLQTKKADANALNSIWLESQSGERVEWLKEINTGLVSKYELVLNIASFISTTITSSKDAPTPEANLSYLYEQILDKLLVISKEPIKSIASNNLVVPL